MPIHVHESPRFEALWAPFARSLDEPAGGALEPETVVVPGAGWESYFTRRLAAERGCCAGFAFPRLGGWVTGVLERVLGPERAPHREPEALTWAVAAELPGLLEEPAFEPVRGYLGRDGEGGIDEQALLSLSRRLGELFDEYLVYRPDLIDAWESGADWPSEAGAAPDHAGWQRRLWERVRERVDTRSTGRLVRELEEALEAPAVRRLLPARLSVFLCGAVPPVHLDCLEAVGRHTEISLYALAPSAEYWADMPGRRQLLGQLRDSEKPVRELAQEQKIDLLHPLLASMGAPSRDRQVLLLDRDEEVWQVRDVSPADDDAEAAAAGEGETLLAGLQHELRAAVEPTARPRRADGSLTVHDCHAPMREVEVLREQLLGAFEEIPDLQPEEVAVLCPDLDTYAPLVHAVFGGDGGTADGAIPYQVSGRSPRRTRPIVEAWFRLLSALRGRLTLTEVTDLLHSGPVARAARLDDADTEALASWARDAGARWGADGAHRREEGLPESDLHTWRFALDRLLAGYCMPPGGRQVVDGVVALDRAEGLAGDTLGRFAAFVDELAAWRNELEAPRSPAEWREPLGRLAERFLAADEDPAGHQAILDAIDGFVTTATEQGFQRALPIETVEAEISHALESGAGGWPFRLGGVVVCDLAAMRSLPYRVIGLLGMNDGVFPRRDPRSGLDLLREAPRRGDRAPRLEDRHLFLEALLAARERLIVTFQGRDARGAGERPASVVVEELLDALDRSDARGDGASVRDEVVVEHPVQPFSPSYFDGSDPGRFSYQRQHLEAARALQGGEQRERVFVRGPLAPETELTEARLSRLTKLVRAPWELLFERLDIAITEEEEAETDREPLVLDPLERYQVGNEWVDRALAGETPDRIENRLRRSGLVPAGEAGAQAVAAVSSTAHRIAAEARENGADPSAEPLSLDLDVDGLRLRGRIEGFVPRVGLRRAMFSRVYWTQGLRFWVEHLVATAASEGQHPGVLVGRAAKGDETRRFELLAVDPETAWAHLRRIVALYRAARCVPLPLIPACVEDAIGRIVQDKLSAEDPEAVLECARGVFERPRSADRPAPSTDPPVRAAFAGWEDPFALRCTDAPGLEAEGEKPVLGYFLEAVAQPMLEHMPSEDS